MIIDLQMTADHFLDGIRNQFRSIPFCFTKELQLSGDTVLLDHAEVTDRTTLLRVPRQISVFGKDATHSISGSAVQVTQEVVLNFVTVAALQDSGAAPTPPLTQLAVTVHFELTVTMSLGQLVLQVEYRAPADVGQLGVLVPDAGQQIDAALSNLTMSVPLNLSGLAALIMSPFAFINVGMVIDDSGILTLRLEVRTEPDTIQSWAAFYSGAAPNRLNGRSWALFVDERLLVPIVLQILDARNSSAGFRASGAPSAQWAANGHGIRATRNGVLPGAGLLGADVDVTVELDLDWSLRAADVLVLRLALSASGETSGIIGTVLDFLGFSPDPGAALPTTAGWTKTGDRSYEHTEFLWIWYPLLGHLTVQDVVPNPDGLLVVGSVLPAPTVVPAGVDATVQPFKWGVHGDCNDLKISALGFIGLRNTGTASLKVCEARVVFDPDEQFPLTVSVPSSPSSPFAATVSVDFRELKPEYIQRPSPYHCLVLIKTNGGARLVSLGVATAASAEAMHDLEGEYAARVVNCKMLVDNFWLYRLNPRWIPDPAPDQGDLHLWQVLVRGLAEQEEVRMLDSDGRVVATGAASRTGDAYVQAVVAPERRGRDVTVLRTSLVDNQGHDRGAVHGDRTVQIRQVRLELTSDLPVGEPVSLLAGRYQQSPVLIVVGSSQARLYDVSTHSQPVLIQDMPVADLGSAGLEIGTVDVPTEFGESLTGPTRVQHAGVLVRDVFARLRTDRTAIVLYRTGSEALI
jgi:hypothetical protein